MIFFKAPNIAIFQMDNFSALLILVPIQSKITFLLFYFSASKVK